MVILSAGNALLERSFLQHIVWDAPPAPTGLLPRGAASQPFLSCAFSPAVEFGLLFGPRFGGQPSRASKNHVGQGDSLRNEVPEVHPKSQNTVVNCSAGTSLFSQCSLVYYAVDALNIR